MSQSRPVQRTMPRSFGLTMKEEVKKQQSELDME